MKQPAYTNNLPILINKIFFTQTQIFVDQKTIKLLKRRDL